MKLTLLIPTHVVVDQQVTKVVAEGEHGSLCLLPRHADFLAVLRPDLLAFAAVPFYGIASQGLGRYLEH